MNRDILRQAKKLQSQLLKAQEELAQLTVEASAGGGAVTVVMNGKQQVQSVKISPEAVDPEDVGILEDLVMAAVNEAIQKSQDLVSKHLGPLAGGLNIPGLM
jgi:hypothetical protein